MAPKRQSAELDTVLNKDASTVAASIPKGTLGRTAKKLRQLLEEVEKRAREEGEDPKVEEICAELRERFEAVELVLLRKIVGAVEVKSAKEYISNQDVSWNMSEDTVEVEFSVVGQNFTFTLRNEDDEGYCKGEFDLAFLGQGPFEDIDRHDDPFGIEDEATGFDDVKEAKEWARQLKIPARQMSPGMLARIVCVTVCLKASKALVGKGVCGDEMSKKLFGELMDLAAPEDEEDEDGEEEEGEE
uniref:Uncharacterized protein n=1 Tax=Chromera velia CCMP2878 TaxID=1169474 RepID=A0A0G4FEJ5_9ALVE|eukprot:Cvel_16624.t1-p1 / transcript=Cvel_16624.t1 / gene=Cvel_16624 / organism=Chromera_velia_CCMP2878 / gene_product=hypothetical protein / transcript_product=hypothetical protein / location=Cvel_scaffold1288:37340-38068(-) / protein_length=243 / sequence_SO=supercontig / SO=protein_coding / is_pseudo=false